MERWQRIDELFHAASSRAPHERVAFLAEACGGDEALRREVESLLAADIAAEELPTAALPARVAAQMLDKTGIAAEQMLNQYRILAPLGAGGMGEVYLAEDTRLRRKVALKLLPAQFSNDPDRTRRFEQEAHAVSALNHPNIITLFDLGRAGKEYFLATEFIDGQTLRQRLRDTGRLPATEALDITLQICQALSAAHEAGIIHRDIKPENVMLRRDGYVKVLDFGLAKVSEGQTLDTDTTPSSLTDPGTVMGTASYMSPEQARGQKVDARSDVFSLGVALYEMIAGRAPFTGVNALEVISEILQSEPLPLNHYLPDLPAELQRIVEQALRKDREQRYQRVKDLLIDIKDLKQELEFEAKLKDARPLGMTPSGRNVATGELLPEGGATNAQSARAVTNEAAAQTTSSVKIILGAIKRHKLGVGVALAIFVAAVSGLAFGLYKQIGRNQALSRVPGPAPRVVPFASYQGNECCPSFSPDGNSIAFAWNGEKGDNTDIYIKLIDAGSALRLTTKPGTHTSPAWAPDGRHIAFVRDSKDENGIFLIPALGGVERPLYLANTSAAVTLGALSWSPDGKHLAFASRGSAQEPFSVYLLSVESLEKQQLTAPPAGGMGDYDVAFSPDGRTLAFLRMSGPGPAGAIYLMPATGGEPKQLIFDPAFRRSNCRCNRVVVGSLAWTRDGREIIYSSNRGGSIGLWRISSSGGTPAQVAGVESSAYSVVIPQQGNRLAYLQYKDDVNIWRFETTGQANRKAAPVKLIASTLRDTGPQYSADGKRIVFTSDRSGSSEIWTCQSDGTNPVQLTSLGDPGTPRWSPDGRQIAFDKVTERQKDIYVIAASGGQPRRITTEASNDVRPSWSRDGKWIYFGSNRTGSWQVWKAPAEGGQAIQVTKQGGREAFESPDGKFVYYTKGLDATSLWRIPVAGAEERQVLDQIIQGYWAVLEKGIYYVNAQAKPHWTIEFFGFATSRATQLAVIEKDLNIGVPGFTVSPDGRWILLMQFDQSESDIMLMENFR